MEFLVGDSVGKASVDMEKTEQGSELKMQKAHRYEEELIPEKPYSTLRILN